MFSYLRLLIIIIYGFFLWVYIFEKNYNVIEGVKPIFLTDNDISSTTIITTSVTITIKTAKILEFTLDIISNNYVYDALKGSNFGHSILKRSVLSYLYKRGISYGMEVKIQSS